jgi:transcriptional regulator with XRE-family HTH domain
MDTIQGRLKSLRGKTTQADFAKELGIPLNTLGRYERGVNNPDLDFLVILHAKFGVSLDWLVLGERPKHAIFGVDEEQARRQSCEGVPNRTGENTLTELYQRLVDSLERENGMLKERLDELKAENAALKVENSALQARLSSFAEGG